MSFSIEPDFLLFFSFPPGLFCSSGLVRKRDREKKKEKESGGRKTLSKPFIVPKCLSFPTLCETFPYAHIRSCLSLRCIRQHNPHSPPVRHRQDFILIFHSLLLALRHPVITLSFPIAIHFQTIHHLLHHGTMIGSLSSTTPSSFI